MKTTKTESLAPMTLDNFTIDGKLDIHDVLTVVVSRAEKHYKKELNACLKQIKELQAQETEQRKVITEMLLAEATAADESAAIRRLRNAVVEFGREVKTHPKQATFTSGDGKSSKGYEAITVAVSLECPQESTATIRLTLPTSKALRSLVQAKEATLKAIETVQSTAVEWKRKMQDIPALEREYKAKIAEAKLKTTEDGTQLLAMFSASLDNDLKLLPSE